MPRAIWSGSISFGMVNIPIKLYTATSDHSVSFHLLHEDCGTRVKYQVYCPKHDKVVPRSELVKGYEYAKNQYAIVTQEDFESLPVPSKSTIDINAFTDLDEVDPIFFDQSYYLEPDEGGAKAYALLVRSLKEKGLVGIAKVTLRNQEKLCALRAKDNALVMETLYFEDEVREMPEGIPKKVEVSERELKMASTLIELLTVEGFDPSEYKDEYRDAVMNLIEAKIAGEEVTLSEAPAPAQVVDLMAALRASVEAAEGRGKKGRAADDEDQKERKKAAG